MSSSSQQPPRDPGSGTYSLDDVLYVYGAELTELRVRNETLEHALRSGGGC